jgi:hypothetical protein
MLAGCGLIRLALPTYSVCGTICFDTADVWVIETLRVRHAVTCYRIQLFRLVVRVNFICLTTELLTVQLH